MVSRSYCQEATVQKSFVDDPTSDRIEFGSGEPHVAIGRILVDQYDGLITDPLTAKMLALLAQLDEAQQASDETTDRIAPITMLVKCRKCSAGYERSTFKGFATERSSFECYGCGAELEQWDTDVVPTYRIAVVPVPGLAEDPVRRIG
jgi:hypothetical protein